MENESIQVLLAQVQAGVRLEQDRVKVNVQEYLRARVCASIPAGYKTMHPMSAISSADDMVSDLTIVRPHH